LSKTDNTDIERLLRGTIVDKGKKDQERLKGPTQGNARFRQTRGRSVPVASGG